MATKKAVPTDETLNTDVLKFLEYSAVNDGWFERARGWSIINRVRIVLGKPKVLPIDEPTADYFESDGAQK